MVKVILKALLRQRFKPLYLHRKCPYSASQTSSAVSEPKSSAAAVKRKAEKPPFAKNLFLGRFDVDILSFPEALDSEKIRDIEDLALKLQSALEETGVRKQESQESGISKLQAIREAGLPIGLQVSSNYGGAELSATECLRISEVIGVDPSVALTLEIQNLVLHTLEKYGSNEQKLHFLPKLASGELLGGYAMSEEISGSDPASLKAVATVDPESGSWKINGQKLWITNANIAQYFLVFLKTQMQNRLSDSEELSVFLIDKSIPGITLEKLDLSVLEESPTYKIIFENVCVPKENLIGPIGSGYQIALSNLIRPKLLLACCMSENLKLMLSKATYFIKQRKQLLLELRESEMVKEKLSKVATTIYALESMLYLTAGLTDQFECDTSLESVIIHVFSTERGLKEVERCVTLLGARGYDRSHSFEKSVRDLNGLTSALQTVDILKLFISLHGLDYAGKKSHSTITKLRNPLNFPSFIFKRIIANSRQSRDAPKLNLGLYMHLHPSLKASADQLEYSVLRLQFAVETLFARHGSEVVNRQLELRRLADVLIDVYAMSSVLARSSRAYCTGIRHSEQEMMLAKAYCQGSFHRVKKNIQDIVEGIIASSDMANLKIASPIIKNNGYFAEHPLKRNIV